MRKKLRVVMFLGRLFLCCSVILSLPKEVFAFALPDTGQTKCYDTAGTEIACAGTGQDGDYNIHLMSYTDNGDGTITDNVTGLMWQKGENATSYNWYQASGTYDATYNPTSQNVCGSLTLVGYSDWRLPSTKELVTIVDYNVPFPGPTINTTYFPNTHAYGYWTSVLSAFDAKYPWYVNFVDGYVNFVSDYGKTENVYVRCVRGGQSAPSFTDNGNGTVTDNITSLIWQQGEPESMTWTNALTYCESLSLGGQSNWRLPNIKELESITDDNKSAPAIDKAYFPDAGNNVYWSSSTYLYDKSAWSVDERGGFYPIDKFSIPYVRCVRGGQSGSANNCAATISSSSVVHMPIVNFFGYDLWLDLQYNASDRTLTFKDYGPINDISPYLNCTASTLSADLNLHLSALLLGESLYWLDMQYGSSGFVITGAGAVNTESMYTVTPSAGVGGSISPNTPQTAAQGAALIFTVTPNGGYTASVGGTCGGTLSGNTYATNAITANCTVVASFSSKYTDNGNGTVTDKTTGLTWQQGGNSSTTDYNWYQASGTYDATYNPSSQSICGSLSLAGGGWRLPTITELESLIDNSVYTSETAGPHIDTSFFPKGDSDYWSSTLSAYNPDYAWHVNFNLGNTYGDLKSSDFRCFVRCVRP